MSFYSLWYEQTINNSSVAPSPNATTLTSSQADLTAAQVTVCTIRDKLVYNMEYKPTPIEEEKQFSKTPSKRRFRVNTALSSSSSSSSSSSASNTSNTFAAASVVTAKFRNGGNHSRSHTRQVSSESLSDISMWDDWIVKYVNEERKVVVSEDSPMEDWIFGTM